MKKKAKLSRLNPSQLFDQLLEKADQVPPQLQKFSEELQEAEIQVCSSDNLVKVVMSGHLEYLAVTIAPEALEKGAEELSTLVTEVVQLAYKESKELMRLKMEELTNNPLFSAILPLFEEFTKSLQASEHSDR